MVTIRDRQDGGAGGGLLGVCHCHHGDLMVGWTKMKAEGLENGLSRGFFLAEGDNTG